MKAGTATLRKVASGFGNVSKPDWRTVRSDDMVVLATKRRDRCIWKRRPFATCPARSEVARTVHRCPA